jgi:hypothetical protein
VRYKHVSAPDVRDIIGNPESTHPIGIVFQAINDIFPEPDMREWFLFYACTTLFHGAKEPMMLWWVGGGQNGKSFILYLLDSMLGNDYSTKLGITLLTGEHEKADRPNSATMMLKNRNFGFFEETAKGAAVNDVRLKEFVNPGKISARELNGKQQVFKMISTIILASNWGLNVTMHDHGTWRRIKYYRAKVKFCANPDPNNKYEKQENPDYINKLVHDEDIKCGLMTLLTYYYERLQNEYGGLVSKVPCQTLDEETAEYRNSQDSVNKFICEMLVLSPNADDMSLSQSVRCFRTWYSSCIMSSGGLLEHSQEDLASMLENSAMSKFVITKSNDVRVISGCRFLANPGEDPHENEKMYFTSRRHKRTKKPNNPVVPQPTPDAAKIFNEPERKFRVSDTPSVGAKYFDVMTDDAALIIPSNESKQKEIMASFNQMKRSFGVKQLEPLPNSD